MSYDYFDSLSDEAWRRYLEKLRKELVELGQCPYQLPADVWVDNPKLWPNIEYPDIYEYLINTPGESFSYQCLYSCKLTFSGFRKGFSKNC